MSNLKDFFRWAQHASTPELIDVRQFHERVTGDAYDGPPRAMPDELAVFRLRFLLEELNELAEALGFDGEFAWRPRRNTGSMLDDRTLPVDLSKTLDALVDLDYVLKGTVLQAGLGPVYHQAWLRVQAANLAKIPDPTATGPGAKNVIKPAGWQPPDLTDLI